MKTFLDLDCWPRKEHFDFFRKFNEPFFGATVRIDCAHAYNQSKKLGVSFFVYYLYKTLVAANAVKAFRYRIDGDRVAIYDRVDASATISREDGSFGFSLIEFNSSLPVFAQNTSEEIERIQNTSGLFTRKFDTDNLIHFSAIPWLDFTSLSHARNFELPDSCPKVSFGKMRTDANGRCSFPMSVHVHHALMDGQQLSDFVSIFQIEMNR